MDTIRSKPQKEHCDTSLWLFPCVLLKLDKVTLSPVTAKQIDYPRISKGHNHWKGDSSTSYALCLAKVMALLGTLERAPSSW